MELERLDVPLKKVRNLMRERNSRTVTLARQFVRQADRQTDRQEKVKTMVFKLRHLL